MFGAAEPEDDEGSWGRRVLTRLLERLLASVPQRPIGRLGRTVLLSPIVGVLAGLAAVALEWALHLGSEAIIGRYAQTGSAEFLHWHPSILLLPALGGLLSGVIVQLIFRKPPGHGTDLMVHAFHHRDGRFSSTAPTIKAVAAVGVISFGGSAGPEGPIAAVGAALGSKVARLVGLTPRDRRTLLIAGCAAGVGALFQCPLGGALFATGVLYRDPEFEGSALVSSFIASVFGYSTFVVLLGTGQRLLSGTTALAFTNPLELPVYLLLGLLCGLTAAFFSRCLRFVEKRAVPALPLPIWLKPAFGGLLTGTIALALPQVMDGRYVFVQGAFDGSLFRGTDWAWSTWAILLLLLAAAKCVATAWTVGSGGAGGVLGPSVFLGGVVGAAVGAALEAIAPGAAPESMRRALIAVGMAGVLSACMRTPLAATVMAMEMTGGFGLVVPLMLVVMTAYIVGGRHGLIEEQLRSPAESPAHAGDALMHLLERSRVGDTMQPDWPLRSDKSTPLVRLLAQLRDGVPPYIVVIEQERLLGVIAIPEFQHLLEDEALAGFVVAADLMTDEPFVLTPDNTLYEAMTAFQQRKLEIIPVVSGSLGSNRRWLGVLTRGAVAEVVERHLRESRSNLLHEHEGFAALQQHAHKNDLLAGLPPESTGDIQRVPIEAELVGQTLASSDYRRSHHAEVLAIHTADGAFLCPADPHRPLDADDTLLILRRRGG